MITLDKDKYFAILRTEGIQAALTALHLDTNGWEIESFEGPKGYQPEMYDDLTPVRAFARELWDKATLGKS